MVMAPSSDVADSFASASQTARSFFRNRATKRDVWRFLSSASCLSLNIVEMYRVQRVNPRPFAGFLAANSFSRARIQATQRQSL